MILRKLVIITLLTDFGLSDHYTAAMKGVILEICPAARIVDITHQIAPQNVEQAAFVLRNVFPWFPSETIHVIVVDPGVGSKRAGLIVRADNQIFIAPDNGVLSYVFHAHPEAEVLKIPNTDYYLPDVSHTFHGRDIFAPVAGHLAAGVPANEIGEPFTDFIKGEVSLPIQDGKIVKGVIIYFDHFGNAVTNIPGEIVENFESLIVGDETIRLQKLSKTYADVDPGVLLALIGSHGNLELAINNGNIKHTFKLPTQTPVIVEK